MRRIVFACAETLPLPPGAVAGRVLDPSHWPDFTGYGPLPGVREAVCEARPPGVIGTRIRVTNTDGSAHVEAVIAWEPDRLLRFAMSGFSPPLSRLSERFVETWEFAPAGGGARVVRTFELYPRSAPARPALWLISRLLRRAAARHLRRLRGAAVGGAAPP